MKHKVHNGKIGRLPESIRDDISRRIRDGKTGSQILPWLNALPEVQSVLASRWNGKLISDANLTEWRQGGYQDWLNDQADVARTRAKSEVANSLAKAANGKLSEGAAAIAGGALFDLIDAADKARREAEVEWIKQPTAENAALKSLAVVRLLELNDALNDLRSGDLEAEKVKLKIQDAERARERLAMEKNEFEIRYCQGVLKGVEDSEARRIAGLNVSNDEKIALMRKHFFADVDALQKSGCVKLPD